MSEDMFLQALVGALLKAKEICVGMKYYYLIVLE